MDIRVQHSVLVWARESLALSRNQVVEKTSINAHRLAQLESGERMPTLDELKQLSKTYKRTIATLLLQNPPPEKPLPADRRTVDSKQLQSFHEKTIMAVRKARAMAHAFVELHQETGKEIPKFIHKATHYDNPKEVAQHIRHVLQLDEIREITNINEALDGYIEKLESLGIAVFQLSLTQDNLRGFALIDDIIPIIGIKRGSEQAHSKTFSLFHELGHILLNEGGMCDLAFKSQSTIEKWCNTFAAEVLIPQKELLSTDLVREYKHYGEKEWRKKDLVELANHFHVGPLAILRSLLELKLTTQAYYKQKHIAWNKPIFAISKEPKGRDLPKEAIQEKGRKYVLMAFNAYDANKISIKDLSDFLGVKLSSIPQTRQLLNV